MSWQFQMQDVSFAGSVIQITGGPGGTVTVQDFMDDANPVEFQDVEVTTVGVNCNGTMIRNAKPNVVMMSVTVIPQSQSDRSLYNMWKAYRVQGTGSTQWEKELGATIVLGSQSQQADKKKYTYSCGTMVSGPGGPSSNGEGKMQGRTYTFAFVKAS